jgi:hypothetical protein
VTSTSDDRGVTASSLYDHLALAIDPEPQPGPEPRPPGTTFTATIETIDDTQPLARLGGLAPL